MNKAEKVIGATICIVGVIIIFVLFGYLLIQPFLSGPRDRIMKNIRADIQGGLQRVVTVYSYSGTPIKTWKGKIDLSSSENEVNMIIDNDKRVIIQGGVVVVEEQ